MPDPSKAEVVNQIKSIVGTAFWAGMTEEEIKAVFITALLEKSNR